MKTIIKNYLTICIKYVRFEFTPDKQNNHMFIIRFFIIKNLPLVETNLN